MPRQQARIVREDRRGGMRSSDVKAFVRAATGAHASLAHSDPGIAGMRVAMAKGMTNTSSQVVVGYDFSHSGNAALFRAIALATRAPFHVLHFACIVDRHAPLPAIVHHGEVDYAYTERLQQALTDIVAQELRAADIQNRVHFFVHVRIGKPAEELLDLARDVGADLIIVGSKGLTGVERLILGSVSEKVVREAKCSVEVARPKTYDYVELADVVEVAPHLSYVPPHRYSYEDHRLELRPNEWPLY